MARSDRDWKPRSHGTQDTANPHAYRALQRIYFKYWEPLRRRLGGAAAQRVGYLVRVPRLQA